MKSTLWAQYKKTASGINFEMARNNNNNINIRYIIINGLLPLHLYPLPILSAVIDLSSEEDTIIT